MVPEAPAERDEVRERDVEGEGVPACVWDGEAEGVAVAEAVEVARRVGVQERLGHGGKGGLPPPPPRGPGADHRGRMGLQPGLCLVAGGYHTGWGG